MTFKWVERWTKIKKFIVVWVWEVKVWRNLEGAGS